jgi:hypothetical protein
VDPDGLDIVIKGENNSSFVVFTPNCNIQFNLAKLGVDIGGNLYFEEGEAIHFGLDLIGFFDPSGIADFLNYNLYLQEGDKENAAVSLVGVIPYLGDFSKLKKYGTILEVAYKSHRHHIIPKAVYKQFADLKSLMVRDGKMNLIDLPAGFHGNYPAYNR